MVNPFIWLLLLSVTMLIGSFLFGCIPLASKLSERKLKQLTAIGVGLLIGTSLVVIIPEGVETLYSSSSTGSSLETSAAHSYETNNNNNNPTITSPVIPSWHNAPSNTPSSNSISHDLFIDEEVAFNEEVVKEERGIEEKGEEEGEEEEHHHDENGFSKHTVVGLALIFGYAVMFIIDQYSSLHIHGNNSTSHSNTKYRTSLSEGTDQDHELDHMLAHNRDENNNNDNSGELDTTTMPLMTSISAPISATTTNTAGTTVVTDDINDEHDSNNNRIYRRPSTSINKPHSMTPTIGLIVHAAADGIALGASASHPKLSMVVFFAIMLHKGPSAFALTTVLLAEGFSRIEVRKHLLLFSMAAPTGAITTYLFLSMTSTPGDVSLEYWTGILLLFSGGTFLYVAMHALQELQSSSPSSSHHHHHHGGKLDQSSVVCILIGMILPMILNLGHSH